MPRRPDSALPARTTALGSSAHAADPRPATAALRLRGPRSRAHVAFRVRLSQTPLGSDRGHARPEHGAEARALGTCWGLGLLFRSVARPGPLDSPAPPAGCPAPPARPRLGRNAWPDPPAGGSPGSRKACLGLWAFAVIPSWCDNPAEQRHSSCAPAAHGRRPAAAPDSPAR